MVPEEVLVPGGNDVQVFIVDDAGERLLRTSAVAETPVTGAPKGGDWAGVEPSGPVGPAGSGHAAEGGSPLGGLTIGPYRASSSVGFGVGRRKRAAAGGSRHRRRTADLADTSDPPRVGRVCGQRLGGSEMTISFNGKAKPAPPRAKLTQTDRAEFWTAHAEIWAGAAVVATSPESNYERNLIMNVIRATVLLTIPMAPTNCQR